MSSARPFSAADVEEIERHGLSRADAEHQVAQLVAPRAHARLERPCRVGDGIVAVDETERESLITLAEEAAREGRVMKFVPASGAATRMFKSLLALERDPDVTDLAALKQRASHSDPLAADAIRFMTQLPRFPFHRALESQMGPAAFEAARERGDAGALLRALLDDDGLGYASLPKGQLLFHEYGHEVRTPFEEHLVEAALYAKDGEGRCRLHATVSPEHREGFDALVARRRPVLETRLGATFDVSYSYQEPSTDTIALDLENRPFRDRGGRPVFRPGGHGALIRNLEALGGDVVLLKNIDNVVPDRLKPTLVIWKKVVAGALVRLQARVHDVLRRLESRADPDAIDDGFELLGTDLSRPDDRPPADADGETARRFVVDRLDRPLRVAGVVRNVGEPGGGPFWVTDGDGRRSIQIVETSQVDLADEEQQAIVAAATHFNPVDIACALRDPHGEPYALAPFVDPETVFISRKSMNGRELKALERPGLWNGAMAGWNSLFVEVPIETFAPVKTVFDLLRPEHQPDEV